ncbi:MAG: amidohydrolase [Proteobacteria bacterium]|nr:MAG: amidohydrolase [Pseudomonadota bacterium]
MIMPSFRSALILALLSLSTAQAEPQPDAIAAAAASVAPKVIEWRRDIHQHPELSNREVRAAKLVAKHLKKLKLDEVREGIAHTGVIGVLKGGKPGPVVALRADMDALPVTEQTGLPFASTARAVYNGQETGVMHACGHDAHTAILMGVAEVLAGRRAEIPGTVLFLFQPAEEGAPEGEEGGAKLMLKEGAFAAPKPAAVFGLHVWPAEAGVIGLRSRGAMAAADEFHLTVKGRQTHGSMPWGGIDPIAISGEIITALQMIPSRQLDITKAPSVITVGHIDGGIRHNIIPDSVRMSGTIRTFDSAMREQLLMRLERTIKGIADHWGASVELAIKPYSPVVYNDPGLTDRMRPSLERAAGAANVRESTLVMGAEDFAFYQQEAPGVFFFLGVNKPGVKLGEAAPNHSPLFYVNDDALAVGVRALSYLALDYLRGATP